MQGRSNAKNAIGLGIFTHILNILKTDVDLVFEIVDRGSHFNGYNLIA